MTKIRLVIALLLGGALLYPFSSMAKEKDKAFLPFYLNTKVLGHSYGIAGVIKGVGQPQASLFGLGLYSDKDDYVGFLSANNYALNDQLLFSSQLYQAQYNGFPYYVGSQGKNDSLTTDLTITDSREQYYQAEFRYLLPWGTIAQEGIMGVFSSHRNVSFSSPLESGVSSVIFKPFYSSRELDLDSRDQSATGFKLIFDWDNRDSVRNPTRGSHTSLTTTVGAKHWKDSDIWSKLEFQNSQYFALGPLGGLFDQQVLAFDFYTADTPSWNKQIPPDQEQVRLGGLYRLRGYTGGRFHDRSAVHYSAEYRVIPKWQPLNNIPVINYYDFAWWQWVLFAEAGRVADEYDLNTLHSDMKSNIGGAIRFQVEGVVVRAEYAHAQDEGVFRVMVNQPF